VPHRTATTDILRRRLPVGAEPQAGGGVHFRVWAPNARDIAVVLDGHEPATGTTLRAIPLGRDGQEYFEGLVADARPGTRYWFRLDDGRCFPDPASRFQPTGPHGPSEVVDPAAYRWHDAGWSGVPRSRLVIYEMHVGTFTKEGTWSAARRELPALAELGITAVEMMPVAEFPGRFGWGYDGVDMFAPTRLYGTPDDLRAFVDAAHHLGIAVLLDVVYNHFGPDGCYVQEFSPYYFSEAATEWGRAINFDGEHCRAVRDFFVANAAYWIGEFHVDGLRLDATQSIVDRSDPHILVEIDGAVRQAGGARVTIVLAENEAQQTEIVRSHEEGGYGLDAIWNDDFHHTAMVALTGRREAYYLDYLGSPQEFVSLAKSGFLYQGQWYSWQEKGRGTPTRGVPAAAFVAFLQNHDQVANSATGARIHTLTSPGRYRALTALLLLGPWTPMLFQGQEFAASSPFQFFADHEPELAAKVRAGRREFLSQFPSIAASPDVALADPADLKTFYQSRLDLDERDRHGPVLALHAALLQLRSSDPTFSAVGAYGVDGAVLGSQMFVLRFFGATAADGDPGDRLLLVNLGGQCELRLFPEPLLAPPVAARWTVVWTSEDPLYGGGGNGDVLAPDVWRIPGECALVMTPRSWRWR
jgi:maltooligosyltrehalose trehalohydrolase